ncbi:NHP2-like protein, partial [Ooceraea biroi]
VIFLRALCEHKYVPYIFIQSNEILGRACGLSRPACTVVISQGSPLTRQIENMQ